MPWPVSPWLPATPGLLLPEPDLCPSAAAGPADQCEKVPGTVPGSGCSGWLLQRMQSAYDPAAAVSEQH